MLRDLDLYARLISARKFIATMPELWQFDLLSLEGFRRFSSERGIEPLPNNTIEKLWQIGLIRADLIRSIDPVSTDGLELVGQEGRIHFYFDSRPVPIRSEGYGNAFQQVPALDGVTLLFHPFRLYVLHHIVRVFEVSSSATQYLTYVGGFGRITDFLIKGLDQWTSKKDFADRFEDWNRTAELAIVVEPIFYERMFQSVRTRNGDTEASHRRKIEQLRPEARKIFAGLARAEFEKVRRAACIDAESADRNKLIHILLRLLSAHERVKLRDDMGKAMLFLCIAEMLRYAFETANDAQLPEEDILGFGQWIGDARTTLLGTDRLLDSSPQTRREFLTSMGMDYGLKVRCYVEGDTEYGALASVALDHAGAQVVNLRGAVIERGGKGLSFVESLQQDITSNVFSIVVLDGDRQDNIRALKKAAAEGRFFGVYFICEPDVELANFTIDELIDASIEAASQIASNAAIPSRQDIATAGASAKSGKEFEAGLKSIGFGSVCKNELWGATLMRRALSDPTLPATHAQAGAERPLVDAASYIVRGTRSGYLRSIAKLKVNPDTGKLESKDPKDN